MPFIYCSSIILSVKKIIVLLLFTTVLFSLHAEVAFYSGEREGEYTALSDKYSVNSIIEVSFDGKSVRAEVTGRLPKTLEGRELGLTKAVLESLGAFSKGDVEVSVRLLKGSQIDNEIENDEKKESGWYSISLAPVENETAREKYKALVFYGFKPDVEITEEGTLFTIPYIAEYELEERTRELETIGFDILSVTGADNPYTKEKDV